MSLKQKIFISGIAGFLGSHLADEFLQLGHEVVGCDNLIGGYLDNVPAKAEFFQYDCTDLQRMKQITRDVDIIVHTAATAYEGLSVFSPTVVTQNVHLSTVALATAAVANKVKRFVLCSSMARYGSGKVPFDESQPPLPEDPYGIAKVASEEVVKNLSKVFGMEYAIAVPHNIIGPRQKYDDPYRNVASIFINLMLQGRQPIVYGDGEQQRCFSMVQDCIQCLTKMALDPALNGQTINIGPDEELVTINQLAKEIAELLQFDLKPVYVPDRPQEVKFAYCSSEKARKLLGYKTSCTLRQGLKEIIEWIKMRGVRPFRYHLDIEIMNQKTPKTWSERMY